MEVYYHEEELEREDSESLERKAWGPFEPQASVELLLVAIRARHKS